MKKELKVHYPIAVMISAAVIMACRPLAYAGEIAIERLEVTSSAFKEGEMIPKRYTGFGENVSPEISWSKPPIGTKCMAIICEDPDAPIGIWTHWVAFNIPYKPGKIPEKAPSRPVLDDGTIQGINDFRKTGYDGPHPPYGTHRYYFKVYALDTRPTIAENVTRAELLHVMEGNILAEGELMGRCAKE
ncbi:MAG: YbhB/YbcL family Raf kinase inhibitor-like protein [Candidatus Omnitrophota bacterium]